MNELYQDKIQSLLNDELMLKVLMAFFTETIEKAKPIIKEGDDNALIGEKFRAYDKCVQVLTQCFIDLTSYKREKKPEKSFNKAR